MQKEWEWAGPPRPGQARLFTSGCVAEEGWQLNVGDWNSVVDDDWNNIIWGATNNYYLNAP